MTKAFTLCALAYIVALAAVIFFIRQFPQAVNPLLLTFYADVAATIVIFVFSMIFKNSSFYDPYWSVAPIVIILFWNSMSEEKFSLQNNLLIAAFFIWGIRLTANWARGWKGLQHEDWRYMQLKKQTGVFYPAVSLLGIHLFPTSMVFIAMIPAYYAAVKPAHESLFLVVIAFVVCIMATMIELIADEQQKSFRSRSVNETEFYQSGIWKYSRHPNYFGEVLFWWGIYLFAIAANPSYWWTFFGAAAMTLMFLFISIPMMEKHMLEKRPHYSAYQEKVSAFIPWFSSR